MKCGVFHPWFVARFPTMTDILTLNENQSAHSEISGAIAFPDGDMHV